MLPFSATNDRRTETRALTSALVRVVDVHAIVTCVLEDLSPRGALLNSETPFPVGAEVWLDCGAIRQRAIVKHCNESEFGVDVGLEFIGSEWPTPIDVPIHRI